MKVPPRCATLLSLAVALVMVGIAAAANSAPYSDAQGDVALAPDLTSLTISNDDAGTITIRVTFDKLLPFSGGDELAVLLDTDQNPDTGTVLYGTEVALAFEGSRFVFARPSGAYFDEASKPPTVAGRLESNAATFTFDAADVGLVPGGGFNVVVDGAGLGDLDTLPDLRTVNYEEIAGTAPVAPGPDVRAPLDHAYKSSGVHGQIVRLWYSAADGRGRTQDSVRVYRGTRMIKTVTARLSDTNPFLDYFLRWRVPKNVRGKLRFCVTSRDAAGNKSNTACAPLTIR